jgi:hypothetical protein
MFGAHFGTGFLNKNTADVTLDLDDAPARKHPEIDIELRKRIEYVAGFSERLYRAQGAELDALAADYGLRRWTADEVHAQARVAAGRAWDEA